MRETVTAGKGPKPAGSYSHAVISGGFVFVSGQGLVDPETGDMPDAFADQLRETLQNVQTILEAAGLGLNNVVKVNAYVTDLTRFAQFNQRVQRIFRARPSGPDDRSRQLAWVPGRGGLHRRASGRGVVSAGISTSA